MHTIFYDRTLTRRITTPLAFTVERYSHSVLGGPVTAEIRAGGEQPDLLELLDRLRCGVEIYDDLGACVWWGYVETVTLEIGALRLAVSLDDVANRVALAYSYIAPGDNQALERRTTPWIEDARSIAEIGVKEKLLSLAGVTDQQALSYRDAALQKRSSITPQLIANSQQLTAKSALISCRGWWHTLTWRYASVPLQLGASHQTIGSLDVNLGQQTGGPVTWGYAQAFAVPSDCYLQDLEIYASVVGSPADRLKVSVWTNPDESAPAVLLAAASREALTLGSGYSWQRFGLPNALRLGAGLRYFLLIERTGSADPANYYRLRLDQTQSYPLGGMLQQVASSWQPGPAADMPFRLYVNEQVTGGQQIERLLADYGQFLRLALVEDGGAAVGSYRDGDATARFEIEALLRIGAEDGRRLLASVDPARRVRVVPEPLPHSPWSLTTTGELRDHTGSPARLVTCPVGMWLRLDDLRSGCGARSLSQPGPFFVAASEYDALENRWTITKKD